MVSMQQVHGCNCVRVGLRNEGSVIENCDSLISDDPDVTLVVHVADCLPISVVDKKVRTIGIIHAGWRGLDKNIIDKTIKTMVSEFLTDPKDLVVNIGPHICKKHYEVKSDVSSKFVKYPDAIIKKNKKIFLDLAKVAEFQLIKIGVKKENINVSKVCTFEDISLPSYRRDKTSERLSVKLNIQVS